MQLFSQGAQQNFQILQDRVGFILITKRLFFGARDGVQALVVHPPKTQGLVLLQKFQHSPLLKRGLHELSGLPQVEEFTNLRAIPHAKDARSFIPLGVGVGPNWNRELRILFGQRLLGEPTRLVQNGFTNTGITTRTSTTGGLFGWLLAQLLHLFGHHRRAGHSTTGRSSGGLFLRGFSHCLLFCHGSATPSGRCGAEQRVIV